MSAVVYDAGVLIAADRNERHVWAEHRVRLEAGIVPWVPSPVVAQASRSRRQVQMRRLLRGCEVIAFDEAEAHRAGALLGKSRTKDIVDASVVTLAIRRAVRPQGGDRKRDRHASIVSDDSGDIRRLLGATGADVAVLDV
jgi:hypothetical protein